MAGLQRLSDDILPLIAQSGRLGTGSEVHFVRCDPEEDSSKEAQFASSINFVVAVFKCDNKTIKQPMVVKKNIGNKAVRDWLLLDYQFRNEVVVYETVLPFLNKDNKISETFPRYFYGSAKDGEDPGEYIIVLEDLRGSGYHMCSELLDLDFAHCALAFKKLGAFHALSFAAKQTNSKSFFDVVSTLIETRLMKQKREEWDHLFGGSVNRAAQPLLEKGEHVEIIRSFQVKLRDSFEYLSNVLAFQEPMAVICHGDFCRNNVLYKYDNGTPTDIKFFDVATARYGSPMLDFSFFYFLNNSEESRNRHREEYLQIYHESLSSTIPGVKVPSLEDFREEFRRKAVHGFLLCSFFKPALMDPVPFMPEVEVLKSEEEKTARTLKNGGEKATEIISNMLREMIDLKCVL